MIPPLDRALRAVFTTDAWTPRDTTAIGRCRAARSGIGDRETGVGGCGHGGPVTPRVDSELVAVICRGAARTVGARSGPVEVVVDPLDTTLWVHLPGPGAVTGAVTGLRGLGLDAAAVNDHRVHILGWSVRLLRWRLGVLLATVDDLTTAEDLTTDLVCYHHDRRVVAGEEVEGWAVLADVEATLRTATPLPHPAPRVEDLDTLLELTAAAGEECQRLIAVHLDRAEHVLAVLTASPGSDHAG